MQSVRQIQRLNDAELEKCVPPTASWHTDYRDTAYVHVGGLPFELSEGDVLTIFSQYGNPVHVNLVRDKETGKSRGFAFLKYEDQRSCDLAVDNLSGAGVLGRVLTVDHARYKPKEGEIEGEGMNDDEATEGDATDTEGDARRKRRRTSSSGEENSRPPVKEELELAKLLKEHDDDDPMKAYLVKEKREQVAEALKNLSVHASSRHSKDQSRRRERNSDSRTSKDNHRSHKHTSRRSRSRDRERNREQRDHRRDYRHASHTSRRDESQSPSASPARQKHVSGKETRQHTTQTSRRGTINNDDDVREKRRTG